MPSNGPYLRIIRDTNMEMEVAFPAIFVHFVNVRYLVMPPFTNHSDAPEHDEAAHGNHPEPTYKQATGYVPSVEQPDLPEEDSKENVHF